MIDALEIWEQPKAERIYMLAGWRQWADAGSMSSGLPQYLIRLTKAHKIGQIRPDGFYLFQFPGTHDLVRPVIKLKDGFPHSLQTKTNDIYYAGDDRQGLVIFLGDEPHLEVERYTAAFLHAAEVLGASRIIGLGGVYGELPYDKERVVSATFSLPGLKDELDTLAVNLSNYQGGASIGTYICKRASEQNLEYISLFAFTPTYDFSNIAQIGSSIRIENDYMAWLGVMRRVQYMLKLELDLHDLERRSKRLMKRVAAKVDELDSAAPQIGVREYMQRLSDEFTEVPFDPLEDVWEEELRRLNDKFEGE